MLFQNAFIVLELSLYSGITYLFLVLCFTSVNFFLKCMMSSSFLILLIFMYKELVWSLAWAWLLICKHSFKLIMSSKYVSIPTGTFHFRISGQNVGRQTELLIMCDRKQRAFICCAKSDAQALAIQQQVMCVFYRFNGFTFSFRHNGKYLHCQVPFI